MEASARPTGSRPPVNAGSIPNSGASPACEGLIEAAWLGAAVVVPLVLHQHAADGFQPYKSTMIRLFAAVMVGAWAIKAVVDRRLVEADRRLPRSLGMAILAVLGAQLLAAIFSINPRGIISIEGNPQGLVTFLADAVSFAGVALFLRRWVQVERLISAVVATSIPVAIYGLLQRAGWEPIAFAGTSERVFSTLGEPIFFAAYLAMVMPLTWWKIARECSSHPGEVTSRRRVLFHAGIALLQLAAFLCAKSRGPLLGLLATGAFFGLGWAVLMGRRQWLMRVVALICAAGAFLVFLNLPLASSARVSQSLGMERFANTLGLRKGADPYRKAHWKAGVELLTSTQPILFPSGGSDRWHDLRPWIGFGPDALANVLPQRYIWPGTDLKPENRLHDCVLDWWFATGAVGAVAFLALFVLIFQQGMKQARLGSKKLIFILAPASAVVLGGLFWMVAGKGFVGLGVVAGIVAGCILSVVSSKSDGSDPGETSEPVTEHRLLPVALLAALVGHLLETGFAFGVPGTELLFWLYAGLVIALANVEKFSAEQSVVAAGKPADRGRKNRSAISRVPLGAVWAEYGARAYVPTLILVTLVYVFVQMYFVDNIDWTTVLGRTLTQIKGDQGASHLVWLLFLPTWLATVFVCADQRKTHRTIHWRYPLTIAAVIAGAFGIVQAAQIAAIGPLPSATDPPATALAQISGYHASYFDFILVILGLLFCGGLMLDRSRTKAGTSRWRPMAGHALAIGLGFAATWLIAFREMHAEITGGWGRALVALGRLDAGAEVLEQTVREMPDSIYYRRELAAALISRAQASHDFETFDWRSRQAEATLIPAAEETHGMSTAGADLARLYMPWAAFTPAGERRLWLAQQAEKYFGEQQRFAPQHPVSWLDSAVMDEFLHQPEEADGKLQAALGVMDWRTGYWADAYSKLSVGCSAPELRQAYATVVFRIYEAALRKAQAPAEEARLRLGKAKLNIGLGHLAEARQECLEIETSLAESEKWQAHAELAEIARRSGDFSEARRQMDKALETAPAMEKPQLLNAKSAIERR